MGRDLTHEDKYTDFNKYIQINLNININQKESVMEYYLMNFETKEKLTELLEIINIDMEKLNNICYNKGVQEQDLFTKVMGLIGAKDKEHYEIFRKEKGIVKEIMDKANDYVSDKDLVKVLDYEKMRDNREIAAEELGFNRGIEYNTQTIAKNMINKDIDIKLISEVTGLTLEQIEKLK